MQMSCRKRVDQLWIRELA